MKKFCLLIVLTLPARLFAQNINDEVKTPLKGDSTKDRSTLDLTLTAGNGAFSKSDKARNAGQEILNTILYTTEASYHHKSGLGLAISAFSVFQKSSLNVYQFAINPSYYFESDDIYTGGSYTYYSKGPKIATNENPYRDEYSAEFKWKKPVIMPSVVFDYSTGESNETFDTTYTVSTPAPAHVVNFTDKAHTVVKDLTVSFTGAHAFTFDKLFSKKDDLSVETALSLNTGNGNMFVTHTNNAVAPGSSKHAVQHSRGLSTNEHQKFHAESVSVAADAYYSLGKFFVEPQVYFDYYLPTTTDKRLTVVYSIGAGFSF